MSKVDLNVRICRRKGIDGLLILEAVVVFRFLRIYRVRTLGVTDETSRTLMHVSADASDFSGTLRRVSEARTAGSGTLRTGSNEEWPLS